MAYITASFSLLYQFNKIYHLFYRTKKRQKKQKKNHAHTQTHTQAPRCSVQLQSFVKWVYVQKFCMTSEESWQHLWGIKIHWGESNWKMLQKDRYCPSWHCLVYAETWTATRQCREEMRWATLNANVHKQLLKDKKY